MQCFCNLVEALFEALKRLCKPVPLKPQKWPALKPDHISTISAVKDNGRLACTDGRRLGRGNGFPMAWSLESSKPIFWTGSVAIQMHPMKGGGADRLKVYLRHTCDRATRA